jgi:vitamin B12 transporter
MKFFYLLLFTLVSSAWAVAQPASSTLPASVADTVKLPQRELGEVVISSSRLDVQKQFLPQKLEIITARDLRLAVSADVGDIIKQLASLDVIQRPSVATYATIRGFRPPVEPGRINPEVTVLVNGRQSGTQNLALFDPNSIERIEILKGAAGATYGSSTMGGLINIITKKSQGPVSGYVYGSYGSFQVSEIGYSVGGNLAKRLDFSFTGTFFDRNDDFRFGRGGLFRRGLGSEQVTLYPASGPVSEYDTAFDGQKRNGTKMAYRSNHLRLGYQLSPNWRVDASLNSFSGRGIETSGDLRNLDAQQGHADRFFTNGDVSVAGKVGRHKLSLLVYQTEEENNTFNNFNGTTVILPSPTYQRSANVVRWQGLQAQDLLSVGEWLKLTAGLDYNQATSRTRAWNQATATGNFAVTERSPFTPWSYVRTLAPFAQAHFTGLGGKLIVNPSARYDMIQFGIEDTPLFANLRPRTENNAFFSPSLSLQYNLPRDWAVHTNVGRAFRYAQAFEIAGYFEEFFANNRVRITTGNPNLQNERSVTWDAGLKHNGASGLYLDLTYFQTQVANRVRQEFLTDRVGQVHTDGRVIDRYATFVNADQAKIRGLEVAASYDFGALASYRYHLRLFANATHLIRAEDISVGDGTRPDATVRIRNVAPLTVNSGIEFDDRKHWAIRLSHRYVSQRYSQDFGNLNPVLRGAFMDFPRVMTLDLSVNYTLGQHMLSLRVSNLTDENYYETRGFNLPGRATNLRYTFRF